MRVGGRSRALRFVQATRTTRVYGHDSDYDSVYDQVQVQVREIRFFNSRGHGRGGALDYRPGGTT